MIEVETTFVEFSEGIASRVVPGPGERVLWIHGYTMDSSLWCELWSHLGEWHHTGIDLPYHGRSAYPEPQHTMPQFARLIGEQALAQGVRHIVGLSLGAILTLQIATEFPDAFASVTLGSAGINRGPNDPRAGLHYWRLQALYKERGAGPWMTRQWMKWPPNIFKGAANHFDLWQRLVEVINRHSWEEFRVPYIGKLTQYSQIDHLERIGRIQSPTLLVLGEEEMPAFKHAAAILQDTIPNCHCVRLPRAGHLCLLERPVASAEAIREHWLQQEAGAP
jgi:pimeloyl-ACP methyl ester carboxylesterase